MITFLVLTNKQLILCNLWGRGNIAYDLWVTSAKIESSTVSVPKTDLTLCVSALINWAMYLLNFQTPASSLCRLDDTFPIADEIIFQCCKATVVKTMFPVDLQWRPCSFVLVVRVDSLLEWTVKVLWPQNTNIMHCMDSSLFHQDASWFTCIRYTRTADVLLEEGDRLTIVRQ